MLLYSEQSNVLLKIVEEVKTTFPGILMLSVEHTSEWIDKLFTINEETLKLCSDWKIVGDNRQWEALSVFRLPTTITEYLKPERRVEKFVITLKEIIKIKDGKEIDHLRHFDNLIIDE